MKVCGEVQIKPNIKKYMPNEKKNSFETNRTTQSTWYVCVICCLSSAIQHYYSTAEILQLALRNTEIAQALYLLAHGASSGRAGPQAGTH